MAPHIPDHTIRPAKTAEEATALWWPLLQELEWNRSEHDAKVYFAVTKPHSSWLLVVPYSTGSPEGCVVPFIYPNSTGWVGFFILNAAFRGAGLGAALWREMELVFRNAGTSVIGLDAVPEQVATYGRRGFVDYARIPLMTRKGLQEKPIDVTWEYAGEGELQDLNDVDATQLATLDCEHTGLFREAFWATGALQNRPEARGFAIVGSSSHVTGFVYARDCEHGARIGPLFAKTYEDARQLLHKVMGGYAGETSFVAEVFGSNEQGTRVFEELGWEYAGISYHRMWLNGKVPVEQQEGGMGTKGMYAIFDAGAG